MNIRDVAADAGVARSTVSYVLSGNKKISPATSERVHASIAKLGYRPDPMARALALKRTNILGFLASVDASSHPADVDVFMRFIRAAMYAAGARGFDVLIMGKGDAELRGDVLADALVVMDVRIDDPRLPTLETIGLPTVLIGIPGDTTLSAFDLDFEQAGRLSAAHLADLGHESVAILGPSADIYASGVNYPIRFRDAFLAECAQRGIRGVCLPCEIDEVEEWMTRAAVAAPELTAIVVQSAGALDPLLDELSDRGVSVPHDCSVLTIAPEPVVKSMSRAVTSIDLPGDTLAARAVDRALDELAGLDGGLVELLPAVLRDRGSTARRADRGVRLFAATAVTSDGNDAPTVIEPVRQSS